jgi:hypothetical protein
VETKTLRTSTILIAVDGKMRLFRNRQEMPARLRERMRKALQSNDASTLLIADRRGRTEILKLLRGEPSALKPSNHGPLRARMDPPAKKTTPAARGVELLPAWLRPIWVRAAIALLVPAAIGAGFFALLLRGR